MDDINRIRAVFQEIWGYQTFRSPQEEIIRSILSAQDALIVMPTGGGKSICFQLPALMQTGLTLVISPLVALMENQVQQLRQRHLPAALLHSELSTSQRKQILQAISTQQLRLLYLSPETLLSHPVWTIISQPKIQINGLILDEAHCLVQWGDTFRPAYRRLGAVRPALLENKPPGNKIAIAAFTATADPQAQKTIQQVLQLQKPQVFLISPYRSNLNLKVQTIWTPRGRKQQILRFIQARNRQTGLIYVRSRRDSEALAQWLQSLKYRTAAYHAGLNPQQRRSIETSWLEGKTQFVVCTCAFGMGIDKPDVRWIVHFQAPQFLSEYIQEVGRGGRDGLSADALTLISEPTGWLDPEDKQRRQFFLDRAAQQKRKALAIAKQIPTQGKIEAIEKQYPDGSIALALLHSMNILEWLDPFQYVQKNRRLDSLVENQDRSSHLEAQMRQYLQINTCRWQFLLTCFGFVKEADKLRCGHCDNCQNRI